MNYSTERNAPNYLASKYLSNILVNNVKAHWRRLGRTPKVWAEEDEQGNWVVRSNIKFTWKE